MQKLLTAVLNALFPPRDTERQLQKVNISESHTLYETGLHNKIVYLSHYANPYIQASVLENKFHHSTKAAKVLGSVLQVWTSRSTKRILFVPIPLGTLREKERMHNQTTSILRQVPGVQFSSTLLIRARETPPQTTLNKVDRMNNMKNAFVYVEQDTNWSDYDQLVIVDDVVTTGATLQSAAASLRAFVPTPIPIIMLAISH